MSYLCTNATHAAELAASATSVYAVVVCTSANASFPSNPASSSTNFYGCGPTQTTSCEPGNIWANCTASEPGEYLFEWNDSLYGSGNACQAPVMQIETNISVKLTNVTAQSTAYPDVSLYGGLFRHTANMIWAYDGADVSEATPIGYFGGEGVTTVPHSCSHLSCIPRDNTTAAPCNLLSPTTVDCFGDAENCFPMQNGAHLCIEVTCGRVPNGTTLYAAHPNRSFFLPPGCLPQILCEQTTIPAIFPDDNTCTCLPGYTNSSQTTCTPVSADYGCSETEYARFGANGTFECIVLTTCDGEPLISATETTDNICVNPPEVCVGFVNSDGICVTPQKTCTSVQIVDGSEADGSPTCLTLSPPCPSHTFESSPPTPTSDRICTRYTGVNVYAATLFALSPCAVYFLIMGYVYRT